jgi:hypothetical protein
MFESVVRIIMIIILAFLAAYLGQELAHCGKELAQCACQKPN